MSILEWEKKTADVIKVGDMVVMDEPYMEIGEKIVSKALDNRIACWLGIEVIRGLKDAARNVEIHVAFTTQEEVGLRGARTAAYGVKPDIGIGVDTTLSCDTPGVPEQDRTTKQGDGFGLHVRDGSFIADKGLVAEFDALATKNKIPFQTNHAAFRWSGRGPPPNRRHRGPGLSGLWLEHATSTQ